MLRRPNSNFAPARRCSALLPLTCLAALLPAACNAPSADQSARRPYGYIWYLDGAGGGGAVLNYASGVRTGLLEAGYQGGGEVYDWNTGLGVVSDQLAADRYKRKQARDLATKIAAYRRQYPEAPTSLIALSAGTAVAVFTLEELPPGLQVDNVVLLGASVSANHDLTQALQHVQNKLYVFTSQSDAVLRYAVSAVGTADRSGTQSAGLRGFNLPPGANAQTRELYHKVSEVPWRQEFARKGNYGGHTDSVNARFVQSYIAPLVMKGESRSLQMPASRHHVDNPDFTRWMNFSVGAQVVFEGHQTSNGRKRAVRVTEKLVEHQQDQLVVERIYEFADNHEREARQFFIHQHIFADEHPLTHARAKADKTPAQTVSVGKETVTCERYDIAAPGDFAEWGSNPSGTAYYSDQVPGGLVKISLKASTGEGSIEFEGVAVEFTPR